MSGRAARVRRYSVTMAVAGCWESVVPLTEAVRPETCKEPIQIGSDMVCMSDSDLVRSRSSHSDLGARRDANSAHRQLEQAVNWRSVRYILRPGASP